MLFAGRRTKHLTVCIFWVDFELVEDLFHLFFILLCLRKVFFVYAVLLLKCVYVFSFLFFSLCKFDVKFAEL